MAKSKKKDDFEAIIDDLKEKTSKMLKKCRKNAAKIAEMDIKLYGITDKEIKDAARAVKGRAPKPEAIEKFELYKVDPT